MNHIYRSIWSESLATWIAVSENTKNKGKCSAVCRKLLVVSLLLCSSNNWALPTGEQVVAGQVSVATPTAGQMQINQSSLQGIVNWQGFSINPAESVNIQQPNASATLLNRVVGMDASLIQGQLNANGQVYLVNPNGVLFSNTAQVDVGGLIASTHNISNADFLSGNFHFTQDGATGAVSNQGYIRVPEGGIVALIGTQVSNEGTIETPKGSTVLTAGKTVDLDFRGNGLVEVKVPEAALNAQINNKGAILADGGRVVLTAQAAGELTNTVLNSEGLIQAHSLAERNGEIILDGGNNGVTQVSGKLDVNGNNAGGKISVTGKDVNINSNAILAAQATNSGTAGTIKVFGNMESGTLNVSGKLDASAPNIGNGGFIETSAAHVKIADSAKITTKASNGKNGSWLIDPYDFTIAASGGDITGGALTTALVSNDVVIQTGLSSATCTGVVGCGTGNSAGVGDIFVNDSVSWAINKLTLSAWNNININANLNASGAAQLALEYGLGAVAAGNTSAVTTYNGAAVNLPAGTTNFTTKQGSDGVVKSYTVITDLGAAGDAAAAPATMTLQGMADPTKLASNYVLGTNIDATSTSGWNFDGTIFQGFQPIGDTTTTPFSGNFDGLGHTITGLYINRPTTDYVGLLGITNGSTIGNIGLISTNIGKCQHSCR